MISKIKKIVKFTARIRLHSSPDNKELSVIEVLYISTLLGGFLLPTIFNELNADLNDINKDLFLKLKIEKEYTLTVLVDMSSDEFEFEYSIIKKGISII